MNIRPESLREKVYRHRKTKIQKKHILAGAWKGAKELGVPKIPS